MGDKASDFASLTPEQGTQLKGEKKLRFVTQVQNLPSPLVSCISVSTAWNDDDGYGSPRPAQCDRSKVAGRVS